MELLDVSLYSSHWKDSLERLSYNGPTGKNGPISFSFASLLLGYWIVFTIFVHTIIYKGSEYEHPSEKAAFKLAFLSKNGSLDTVVVKPGNAAIQQYRLYVFYLSLFSSRWSFGYISCLHLFLYASELVVLCMGLWGYSGNLQLFFHFIHWQTVNRPTQYTSCSPLHSLHSTACLL